MGNFQFFHKFTEYRKNWSNYLDIYCFAAVLLVSRFITNANLKFDQI